MRARVAEYILEFSESLAEVGHHACWHWSPFIENNSFTCTYQFLLQHLANEEFRTWSVKARIELMTDVWKDARLSHIVLDGAASFKQPL